VGDSSRSKLDFDRAVFMIRRQGIAPLGLEHDFGGFPTLPASRLAPLRLQGGLTYVAPPALALSIAKFVPGSP
jgi:hypothetical protein